MIYIQLGVVFALCWQLNSMAMQVKCTCKLFYLHSIWICNKNEENLGFCFMIMIMQTPLEILYIFS